MKANYVEVLTKCPDCGKHFNRKQSSQCPHKFIKQVPDISQRRM